MNIISEICALIETIIWRVGVCVYSLSFIFRILSISSIKTPPAPQTPLRPYHSILKHFQASLSPIQSPSTSHKVARK